MYKGFVLLIISLKNFKFKRRGIPASPVLNGFCGDYEYGMEKSVVFHSSFNYGWPTCF